MKKFKTLALATASIFTACGLASCNPSAEFAPVEKENVKIGLICLHDESSTYDKNFIEGMNRAVADLGLNSNQVLLATGIDETAACKDKAVEFASKGCQAIFADSFGHEDYMIQAAQEFPNVRFAHATGTKAHTVKMDNYSNAFASIYEGRYLAGVAAGMKLQEMKTAGKLKGTAPKLGYVGAFPYEEVKSGYTAFYLGAKSIVEDVTMEVRFTGSWYDPVGEKNTATALINAGADIISQHADSMGAPEACETAKVPNVTYNGSTASACPDTYLVSSKINWTPYFKYMINQVIKGERLVTDYTGSIADGSVELDAVGTCAAAGTQDKINDIKSKLLDGSLHVFDTSKFTVGGKKVESHKSNVDFDDAYTPDTEVIADGYFHESEYRSAPYFDLDIDGITIVE